MATDAVLDFYDALDFEIIDFDGYDTLFVELLDDGTYATVSDDDGHMPDTLDTPIVFNVYDDTDSFQWSVSLNDSHQLQALLEENTSTEDFLNALQMIRTEKNETYQKKVQKKAKEYIRRAKNAKASVENPIQYIDCE